MVHRTVRKQERCKKGRSCLHPLVTASIPLLVVCSFILHQNSMLGLDTARLALSRSLAVEAGDYTRTDKPNQNNVTDAKRSINEDLPKFQSPCFPDNMTVVDTLQVPDLIIAGAQKAGTSALYSILKKHPDMASSIKFETHYFDLLSPVRRGVHVGNLTDDQLCEYQRGYREHFHVKDQFSLQVRRLQGNITHQAPRVRVFHFEKTPIYFCLPLIPEYIKRIAPWTKVLIVLRDPVERAYSEYKMLLGRNSTSWTFETMVDKQLVNLKRHKLTQAPQLELYKRAVERAKISNADLSDTIRKLSPLGNATFSLDDDHLQLSQRVETMATKLPKRLHRHVLCGVLCRGMYSQQLAQWIQHYELGQNLMVIQYERFVSDRAAVLTELYEFVGVRAWDLHDSVLERSYSPRLGKKGAVAEPFSNTTREYLTQLYQPYNDELVDLLGEKWRGVWK